MGQQDSARACAGFSLGEKKPARLARCGLIDCGEVSAYWLLAGLPPESELMQPQSAVLASFWGRVTPLPPLRRSEVKWFRCVSVWLPWNVPQVGRFAEGRPPELAACARGQKSKDNWPG